MVEGADLVVGKQTAVKVRIALQGATPARNVRAKVVYNGQEFGSFYPLVQINVNTKGEFLNKLTSISSLSPSTTMDLYFFSPGTDFDPVAPGTYNIRAEIEADGVPRNSLSRQFNIVRKKWGGNDELYILFAPIIENIKVNQDTVSGWVNFLIGTFPVGRHNVISTYHNKPITLSTYDKYLCVNDNFSDPDQQALCRRITYINKLLHEAKTEGPNIDRVIAVAPKGWLGGGGFTPTRHDIPTEGSILEAAGPAPNMAHELGHTYGLYIDGCEEYNTKCHNKSGRLYGDPVDGGLDPLNKVLKQDNLWKSSNAVNDLMGGGEHSYHPPQLDYWVNLDTYNKLLNANTGNAENSVPGVSIRSTTAQPVLLLDGAVTKNGDFYLPPFYIIPDGRPTDLPLEGDVLIQLQDENNTVLYQGGLPVSTQFTSDITTTLDMASLVVEVPFNSQTRYVVISLFGRELERRLVSANPPTVAVVSPAPGMVDDSQFEVRWQAFDPDNDPVKVSVLMSSDGGQTWETMEEYIEGTSYQVEPGLLTPGGSYWIKLIASDGVQTTTTTAGPFVIKGHLYLPALLKSLATH
ncbi:MAG: hypothetical protein EXR62_11275 [Chloroflexi bacterium]|nr:hypothetical protein [Chloroflexota bacterium]